MLPRALWGSVDSLLPGSAAPANYRETQPWLKPGDSLTFLLVGIGKAQNAAGELQGFARTEALATKRADEIAHAVQAFGQSDYITVLTLAFVPVHAAVRPGTNVYCKTA